MSVFILATALVGCSRFEWVPDYLSPECANYRRPTHRFVDTIPSTDPADPSVLSGRIVAKGSHQPVGDARVTLRHDSVNTYVTDSTGRFRIVGLQPGRYLLDVLRVGYDRTSDSISVPLLPGHEIEVQLQMANVDGPCSGLGEVRVRKPWWKLW